MPRAGSTRPARSARVHRLSMAGTAVVAVAVGIAATACGGETSATPSDPVLAKGKQIHESRCASCHGIRGQGGTGKKLADGVVTRDLPTVADHVRVVTDGLKGTSMPPWKDILTAEEIQAVVRYQREVLAPQTSS